MTLQEVCAFLRAHKHAVQASVAPDGSPQAAVVGIAVTDALELVFDTLGSTRKAENLRQNPRIALVAGGMQGEQTLQLQGIADEPSGAELERLKRAYFLQFPDGPEREHWPGIAYFRVRPTWLRFSDFGAGPPRIVELDAAELRGRVAG